MRLLHRHHFTAALLLLSVPVFAAAPKTAVALKTHRHASVRHAAAGRKGSRATTHTATVAMPAERATAIQSALIKRGYLEGAPTGTWDAPTVSAMAKLQADNGWQSRITPDSRALIKLGLGPNSDAEQTHEGPQSPPR